jgi:hypothetical protein
MNPIALIINTFYNQGQLLINLFEYNNLIN